MWQTGVAQLRKMHMLETGIEPDSVTEPAHYHVAIRASPLAG